MPRVTYSLRGKLWRYSGQAAWFFITLPKGPAKEVRGLFEGLARGASLPAVVTVGGTTWTTAIFWDKKAGSYLLPVKADVRKAESLEDGGFVAYRIEVGD